MAAEIIRITVLSVTNGRMDYLNVITRAHGSAVIGDFHLTAGTEALVELDNSGGRQIVLRVLEPKLETTHVETTAEEADEALILVNGVPLPPAADDVGIEVGQVRTAEIAFTTFRTGPRDRGRSSKRRPCVVVKVEANHVAVCPIHGSASAVARSWSGRKLLGWRALGMKKASSVNSASVLVSRDSLGELIGVLDADDRRRLGL
jgi:hypothetical protein